LIFKENFFTAEAQRRKKREKYKRAGKPRPYKFWWNSLEYSGSLWDNAGLIKNRNKRGQAPRREGLFHNTCPNENVGTTLFFGIYDGWYPQSRMRDWG